MMKSRLLSDPAQLAIPTIYILLVILICGKLKVIKSVTSSRAAVSSTSAFLIIYH
jgi:hypothetical protein